MNARPIDQLEFRGAIGNMPFRAVLMNQFVNALSLNGWREAHNGHIYKRLVERGMEFGLNTPDDFARALRDGFTQPAAERAYARVCRGGLCWVIFKDNEFITIRHSSAKK